MIDLYSWPTPNGRKVHIMLEECGLAYAAHPVDIRAGDQFSPEFLKISPNNRIPAIVDHEGPEGHPVALFESGAILIYLAEKTGRFLPEGGDARYRVLQWLMWQMGGVGPMFGQANHFRIYARERMPLAAIEYGIERYTQEANRLTRVLDAQLADRDYVAGETVSIADFSLWPWFLSSSNRGIDWESYPHARRWYERIKAREAVGRAMTVLTDIPRAALDDKAWEIMFGARQFGGGHTGGS